MNVHTPERQPNESREQYKQRRAVSRELVSVMLFGVKKERVVFLTNPDGTPAPSAPMGDYFAGQHRNPQRNRQRKLKKIFGRRALRRAQKAARREKAST